MFQLTCSKIVRKLDVNVWTAPPAKPFRDHIYRHLPNDSFASRGWRRASGRATVYSPRFVDTYVDLEMFVLSWGGAGQRVFL